MASASSLPSRRIIWPHQPHLTVGLACWASCSSSDRSSSISTSVIAVTSLTRSAANNLLSRPSSFLLHKDQAHQPRGHRESAAGGFAPHHHAAVIVGAQRNHRHRGIIFLVGTANQIDMGIRRPPVSFRAKGQSDLFCVHKDL